MVVVVVVVVVEVVVWPGSGYRDASLPPSVPTCRGHASILLVVLSTLAQSPSHYN